MADVGSSQGLRIAQPIGIKLREMWLGSAAVRWIFVILNGVKNPVLASTDVLRGEGRILHSVQNDKNPAPSRVSTLPILMPNEAAACPAHGTLAASVDHGPTQHPVAALAIAHGRSITSVM